MKNIFIITFLLLSIIPLKTFAQETTTGYREFMLGQSVDKVKSIINTNYKGNKIKYLASGDIEVETADMVYANLFFSHKKVLYLIKVNLKYGDIAKVKEKLVEKYGQPNDYNGEEEDRGNKLYLMGRWLFDKRYSIHLWDSYYCRNQKFIPCVISVNYLDLKEKEAKEVHERTVKEDDQKKKDNKTYGGF